MSYALIVDDCRTTRSLVRRMVVGLGFETREAGCLAEALAALDPSAPPSFALVDWEMPDGTGVELVRAWRSDPRLSETRLIMMTVRDGSDDIRTALAAGADEFLMKPLTREAIADKLALLEFAWTGPEQERG